MACEIFGSGTSPLHAVGHVAEDGNVYTTPLGGGEHLGVCVGHIAQDGNVYTTPRGYGEATGSCVGHIGQQNEIFTNSKFQGDTLGYCAGHVDDQGFVYTVPAGVYAGTASCVGRVVGAPLAHGAAALLLLLRTGNAVESHTLRTDQSSGGYGGGGGGGGGAAAGHGKQPLPPTIYHTEEELVKALFSRWFWLSVVACGIGLLFSNGERGSGICFGLLVGTGLAFITLFGFTDRVIYQFDTKHCKRRWLGALLRHTLPFGFKLPLTCLALAVLIAIGWLSGSSALPLALLYLCAIVGLSLWIGKAIRRKWRK